MAKSSHPELDRSKDVDDMVYVSDAESADAEGGDAIADAKPGMIPKIKNLYVGDFDDNGRYRATDEYPKNLPDLEETEETAKFALLVRNCVCYDGRKQLSISVIVVQSPLLKKVIASILKGYSYIAPELNGLELFAPFRPFVHRWQRLTEALRSEKDPETKSHIQLLHDTLQPELQSALELREECIKHNAITFSCLWMLFEPGTTILGTANRRRVAGRSKSAYNYKDLFRVEYEYIYWNGEAFYWVTQHADIPYFAGTKKITELYFHPLELHPRVEQVKHELIFRGRKYEMLKGIHAKQYHAVALSETEPVYVDSRIIIDIYAYNSIHPELDTLREPITKTRKGNHYDKNQLDGIDAVYYDDEIDDLPATDRHLEKSAKRLPENTGVHGVPSLTEDQLMLCAPAIKGYSLQNKRWYDFFVNEIEDIEWNEPALYNVILDYDRKVLISDIIEGHASESTSHRSGLNFLISGQTGVGKTMAVEVAAESSHVPILYLKDADIEPELDEPDLENRFTKILRLCARWQIIVLYDNVDKTLDVRNLEDEAKDITSSFFSFLHALESHRSLLFVTTADAEIMPTRLLSRFHICLEFPALSTHTRRLIWENKLQACDGITVFADPNALARWDLNGREIANAVTAAKMLAVNGKLTMWDLERVVAKHKRTDSETEDSDYSEDESVRYSPIKRSMDRRETKRMTVDERLNPIPSRPLRYENVVEIVEESPRSGYSNTCDFGSLPRETESKKCKKPMEEELGSRQVPEDAAPRSLPHSKESPRMRPWNYSKQERKDVTDIPLIPAKEKQLDNVSSPPSPPPPPPMLDDWNSYCGTSKKSKKKAAVQTVQREAQASEDAVPVPADDDWGSWGLAKKTKKTKVHDVADSLPAPLAEGEIGANGPEVKQEDDSGSSAFKQEDVKTLVSSETPPEPEKEAQTVDSVWGFFGTKATQKPKKKKAREPWWGPETAVEKGDMPEVAAAPVEEAPAADESDIWATAPKAKKKGKKNGCTHDHASQFNDVPW
ncbi:MAG: hypothetical protein Q9190_003584 [Brigantiaea leucoxantha]